MGLFGGDLPAVVRATGGPVAGTAFHIVGEDVGDGQRDLGLQVKGAREGTLVGDDGEEKVETGTAGDGGGDGEDKGRRVELGASGGDVGVGSVGGFDGEARGEGGQVGGNAGGGGSAGVGDSRIEEQARFSGFGVAVAVTAGHVIVHQAGAGRQVRHGDEGNVHCGGRADGHGDRRDDRGRGIGRREGAGGEDVGVAQEGHPVVAAGIAFHGHRHQRAGGHHRHTGDGGQGIGVIDDALDPALGLAARGEAEGADARAPGVAGDLHILLGIPEGAIVGRVHGHQAVVSPAVGAGADLGSAALDHQGLALEEKAGNFAVQPAGVADGGVHRGAGDAVADGHVAVAVGSHAAHPAVV